MNGTHKQIFIVITQTGTMLSRILKRITGAEYNHASLSLSQDLTRMYSFGRRHPYNPFWGGFVIESPHAGTFRRFSDTTAIILAVEITEERYAALEATLEACGRGGSSFPIIWAACSWRISASSGSARTATTARNLWRICCCTRRCAARVSCAPCRPAHPLPEAAPHPAVHRTAAGLSALHGVKVRGLSPCLMRSTNRRDLRCEWTFQLIHRLRKRKSANAFCTANTVCRQEVSVLLFA